MLFKAADCCSLFCSLVLSNEAHWCFQALFPVELPMTIRRHSFPHVFSTSKTKDNQEGETKRTNATESKKKNEKMGEKRKKNKEKIVEEKDKR